MLARDIYQLLVGLKEDGITVLLVDQNIRQAVEYCRLRVRPGIGP